MWQELSLIFDLITSHFSLAFIPLIFHAKVLKNSVVTHFTTIEMKDKKQLAH